MNKYKPEVEEIKELSEKYNVIPVYRELIADMETPVSAYEKIGRYRDVSFLLESVEGSEKVAGYSFIGIDPFLIFKSSGKKYTIEGIVNEKGENPIERLKSLLGEFNSYHPANLPRLSCGAVGYFSYDTIRLFEDIPNKLNDSTGLEEINFGFYKTILVFDNRQHKLIVFNNILSSLPGNIEDKYKKAVEELEEIEMLIKKPIEPRKKNKEKAVIGEFKSDFDKKEYFKSVDRIKEYIRAGDAFQVVLSQRFRMKCTIDPYSIYRSLRIINPSPYMYFMKLGDAYIVGASPELLVRVENGVVETRPIAGTRPRGKTLEEDIALEKELLADEKERAEHIMLVDLGRNDLGRVSEMGTVVPEEFMKIEKYSHVMHIVSAVKGKIKAGISAIDALFSCFPAGTLSGAPKIRAMEIIDELEPTKRGIYGGALGYIDFSGNLDTCIVIRTLVMKDGEVVVQAGGGIVADSDPEKEYMESRNKAKALFSAIKMANKLQEEF